MELLTMRKKHLRCRFYHKTLFPKLKPIKPFSFFDKRRPHGSLNGLTPHEA